MLSRLHRLAPAIARASSRPFPSAAAVPRFAAARRRYATEAEQNTVRWARHEVSLLPESQYSNALDDSP